MTSSSHQLLRTFHTTCMVSSYDRTIDSLGNLVGLRPLEYSEAEFIGRRGGVAWVGDNGLEVAQPIVEGHAAQRFLLRFGPGMHSYAFQVLDLDATLEAFATNRVRLGVRPASGFCFTDPRTTGGLLFEWSEYIVKEDPRAGAALPPQRVEPLLEVSMQAFAGAVLADPVAWAEEFSQLFGLTETFRDTSADAGEPVVGLAGPDCTLALFRLPGDDSLALWGTDHPRARFHVLGLTVPSLESAAGALEAAGIRMVRRTESMIVVDPSASGEVPLLLLENLLPGDPRR